MKEIRLLAVIIFMMTGMLLLGGQNQTFAQEKGFTSGILHSLAPGDSLVTGNPLNSTWEEISKHHSLFQYQVYKWRDTNNSTKIDSCDTIWLQRINPSGECLAVHVKHVTLTLILDNDSTHIKKDVEFTGGASPDSISRAINTPVCTWWFEVWPDTLWNLYYHIDEIQPGPPLQTSRHIRSGSTWYHVEDVAIDITAERVSTKFPCPGTPTLTQWGLIILVVLLIGSAVFIMLRRRKAVPA